jgi:glycerol-3-phosphate acyltransferase PlsY
MFVRAAAATLGATNVSRKSPVLGLLTLLLDALKGAAGVALAHFVVSQRPSTFASEIGLSLAALFAVLGHLFPIWLKFRGGKGVATGLGSFVVIAPRAMFITVIVFLVIVIVSRYVSLASIIAVVSFPPLVYWIHIPREAPIALGCMTSTSLLIIAKHHENIRRLLAGTERRLGAKLA